MKKLSRAVSKLKPEEAFIYLSKALKLKEQGRDVISFGIGQPDFSPPRHLIELAKKALNDGYSGYGPSLGLPELREAIAEFLNESYRTDIKPEEVMVTVGAKTAVFMGIISLVEPGDEVLIPDPGYPLYESAIRYAGGKPVFVPLNEKENFRLSYESFAEKINERTKMIILNYPQNPTGSTLEEKDVRDILEEAERRGIVIMSDEIYDRYSYDAPHFPTISYEGWRNLLYYVNGFSKTFAVTGWRVGYLVTNRELIEKLETVANNIYSCPVTFVQKALADALEEGINWFKPIFEEFKARRDIIYEELNKLKGVRCVKPKGAFYTFPDVKGIQEMAKARDTVELVERMLYETGVLALPGEAFPGNLSKGHLRFSFALPRERIREGIDRIRRWIEAFKTS